MYACLYVFVWIVALTFCSGWHFFLLLLILFGCDAIAQTGKEFLYITLCFAFALRRFSLHAFVILLCVRMYVFFSYAMPQSQVSKTQPALSVVVGIVVVL